MDDKTWSVVARSVMAMSVWTGLTMGGPAVVAADEAAALMLDDGPARSESLFRVEWTATPGRSGRAQLEGSVHNDYGRPALNVQLRISEIDASGETVSTVIGPTLDRVPGQGEAHFTVQVPDPRRSYRVAVAAFSFDFAGTAAR